MGRRTWLPLAAVVVACASVTPAPAVAHDHRRPLVTVVTPRDEGRAALYTSTWARRAGRYCEVLHADGIRRYGTPPVQWVPVDELAVRFHTSRRPDWIEAVAYPIGDPLAGVPIYGGEQLTYGLRRVRVGGRVMWEAVLDAPASPDLYVDVTAEWADTGGCGTQSASWTFRAGVLPV